MLGPAVCLLSQQAVVAAVMAAEEFDSKDMMGEERMANLEMDRWPPEDSSSQLMQLQFWRLSEGT